MSVNRHVIARNTVTGSADPVISWRVGKSGKPRYAWGIKIDGPSEVVYDPRRPILKCGARLVIVCDPADVQEVGDPLWMNR